MSLQLSGSLSFGRKKSHFRSLWFSHHASVMCIGKKLYHLCGAVDYEAYKCEDLLLLLQAASLDTRIQVTSARTSSVCFEEAKERITKLIHKAELSVSTYDTAWVAMVPSPHSLEEPCFPDCLNWLLENQCHDGSWARPHHHPLLQKDVLSSTLACVLALRKWGVGEEQIKRGVHFIELNFASATEEGQISPMGFDIVFPSMLEYARDLFLNLNLEPTTLTDLIHKRDLELKRCYQSHSAESEVYLAYVAEGMGKSQDWKSVMKYQRGNGSLFNSPSTTAAAFIGLHDAGCLNYLQSALKKIGNADQISETVRECLSNSFRGNMKDIHTTLELYRASEFILCSDERDLEKQNIRLKDLLEQELSGGLIHSSQLGRNIDKEDFLFLSMEDFNKCQAIHREELKELERWVAENRLDELKFARRKSAYCYFSAAATFFSPELSDARMSWAKNGVLTTVVDDFFDVGGSVEELKNLIHLVEAWDVDVSTDCFSQNVQIIFSALRRTICEIGEKGFIQQERSVTNHIINIWLELLYSMMKETEWARDNYLPTIDEYMSNAYVSFALGPIVLPALYLIGPKLSDEVVHHSEFHNLFKLMSTCGRILNDIRTCERELKDGKLNAVPLYVINGGGKVTKRLLLRRCKVKTTDSPRRI
ncbi:UNVERIFIED_CONTAM: Ent-kaurene synthase TSP4, chloroplastic [Sesamum radiatum]|uniref:Ent-kaurene synthase TSP4, chloroplastic n=1 Tax=Sesamum radiatum TaxID=300843 RepID=A0AAW2T3C1_SESRA